MKQTSPTLSLKDFRQTDTCPDCIERNDVDLTGRPRKGRHHRINQCAGCAPYEGIARIPRVKFDAVQWLATKQAEL